MPDETLENPYPDRDEVEIDTFAYTEPLIVGREDSEVRPGAAWKVWEDYRVSFRINGEATVLVVPKGTLTDFSTVPAPLRPVVARVGAHLEASVVHDYLYDAWAAFRPGPTERDRLFADKVFLAALVAAEVPAWRRTLMYQAVRRFGWSRFVAPIEGGRGA